MEDDVQSPFQYDTVIIAQIIKKDIETKYNENEFLSIKLRLL